MSIEHDSDSDSDRYFVKPDNLEHALLFTLVNKVGEEIITFTDLGRVLTGKKRVIVTRIKDGMKLEIEDND